MTGKQIERIKILVVEDHQIIRIGLKMALAQDFMVVGEADDGLKAVRLANELRPDVILMDIGLPQMDGVKATSIIKQELGEIRIIMLTSHISDKDILAALAAGADGYCLKEIHISQLTLAIHAVVAGSAWLDAQIANRILGWTQDVTPSPAMTSDEFSADADAALSAPELAVLRLVAEGLSNQKIATRLDIDLTTIVGDMRRIVDKLAVSAKKAVPI